LPFVDTDKTTRFNFRNVFVSVRRVIAYDVAVPWQPA